jgi:hypothetical protein
MRKFIVSAVFAMISVAAFAQQAPAPVPATAALLQHATQMEQLEYSNVYLSLQHVDDEYKAGQRQQSDYRDQFMKLQASEAELANKLITEYKLENLFTYNTTTGTVEYKNLPAATPAPAKTAPVAKPKETK